MLLTLKNTTVDTSREEAIVSACTRKKLLKQADMTLKDRGYKLAKEFKLQKPIQVTTLGDIQEKKIRKKKSIFSKPKPA